MSIPTIKIGDDNWAVKPSLFLGYNDTNGIYIPREFTVSRGTTALEVDSAGILTTANNNIARIDYLNFTKGALFIEASAQNLALQSEAFTLSANWNTSIGGRTLVTGNVTATLDPYGGNAADLLSDDNTASSTHRMYTASNVSITSGTTYSTSFFVKANTTPWFEIRLMQSNETDAGIVGTVFNLTSGTITSGSGTIQNYGNGWYRCTNIGTSNFTGNGRIFFYVYDSSGTKNYNGTSSNSLYIFGAQLEVSSVATSYIPTTTGTGSRAADTISLSNVSNLIGQTEGTIYAEFVTRVTAGTAAKRVLTISNGDDGNRISIGKAADDSLVGLILTGGVTQALISTAANQSGTFKMALAFQANDAVLYINGVQIGTDNSVTMPTGFNRIDLGQNPGNAFQFNDRIRAAAVYTSRLSNDNLMLLTLPTNDGYLPTSIWNYYLSKPGVSEVSDCLYERYFNILNI